MNKLFNKTDEFLKIGGVVFEQKVSAFCTTSDLSAFWALENGINPVERYIENQRQIQKIDR